MRQRTAIPTTPQRDPLDAVILPVTVRWDAIRNRWTVHGSGIKNLHTTIVEITNPRRSPDGTYRGSFVRAWVPWPSHRDWRVAGPNDRLGNRLVLEQKIAYTRDDPT